jgi:GxxExxY protein
LKSATDRQRVQGFQQWPEPLVDTIAAGRKMGIQQPINLIGDFRADEIVEHAVLLELKAARVIEPVYEVQLLKYPKATELEVGHILNFGP